jgi:hypothetical protein
VWSQDIGDASFSGQGLPLARAVGGCVQQSGVRVGLIRVLGVRSRMIDGHRVILREPSKVMRSKGIDAMTTAHDIDWPQVLADRLTRTSPDVLRELLATFIHTLMGAEADARVRPAQRRARQLPQRVSAPPIRHPIRNIGSRDPEAAARLALPGLAAGAPQTRRAGTDHRRGYLLGASIRRMD